MSRDAQNMGWSEPVPYSCACGTQFEATRQRWVDADADRSLRDRIVARGPVSGTCPDCGREAEAHCSWLELHPSRKQATLVLGPEQRAELVEQLKSHLDNVVRHGPLGASWLLRPDWRFARSSAAPGQRTVDAPANAGVPSLVGNDRLPPSPDAEDEAAVQDAFVTSLSIEGDLVTIDTTLDDAERRNWGTAAVTVRPIHLSSFAYPIAGVRVVASYLGQSSVLDGLIDVASSEADPVFSALSRSFRLLLVIRDRDRKSTIRREIAAAGLERNAALCLESARSALATREYPPGAFTLAWQELAALRAEERTRTAKCSLAPGAFQHLMAPRETWAALEDLNRASAKENLAHLLQIDGLPVGEYEAIRKRVLRASIEQGICAPSRFWRRIVDTGLAGNISNYAEKLISARSGAIDQGLDDLDNEQVNQAWRRIYELCRKKHLEIPSAVLSAIERQPSAKPAANKPAGKGLPPPGASRSPIPRPVAARESAALTGEIGLARPSSELKAPLLAEEGGGEQDSEEKKKPTPPALSVGPTPKAELSQAASIPEIEVPELAGGLEAPDRPAPAANSASMPALSVSLEPPTPEIPPGPAAPDIPVPGRGGQAPVLAAPALGAPSLAQDMESREDQARALLSEWEASTRAQLIDLAPELARFARPRVAALMFKLAAPQSEQVLAAGLLLALGQDPGALAPICCRLFRDERSAVWQGLAWSASAFGPPATKELLASASDEGAVQADEAKVRLLRALSEILAGAGPSALPYMQSVQRENPPLSAVVDLADEATLATLHKLSDDAVQRRTQTTATDSSDPNAGNFARAFLNSIAATDQRAQLLLRQS